MPTYIKIVVSIFIVAVSVAVFLFEKQGDDTLVGTVATLLGVYMVFAIWIFPETKKVSEINQET